MEERQRSEASTNHLHVHQINLTLSLCPSPSAGLSFGRKLLTSPPSLRWEKRGDFLSFLSPSVSFITPVVISWSRDFFSFCRLRERWISVLCASSHLYFLLTSTFFEREREETPSLPPSQKEADNQEGVSTFAGVFISQDTISCSIAHHHAGIFSLSYFFSFAFKSSRPLLKLTLEKLKGVLVRSGKNTTVCEEIKLSQTALLKTETEASGIYPFKNDVTRA